MRAAPLLTRLAAYEPRKVVVDGLTYREGLNASRSAAASPATSSRTAAWSRSTTGSRRTRRAEQAIAYLRDEVLAGFELEVLDAAAGARPGLDQPAAAAFVAAVGAEPSAKFGWTDVARFAAMGVPAVNFGPGNPSKAHADDEFCPASELTSCYDALVRWLS